jgi:xanthine dehydrogenase small subunit
MIRVNGEDLPVRGVPAQTTLLDFLRDHGLTGAKEGCAEGECGACTIAMVAGLESGCNYKTVNSCLIFVPGVVDREFYTVESLAQNGELAEVQKAIANAGGSQCGYCTPGFVMSLFVEQYRAGRAGPCDPHALSGNLCRCTGYRPIRDAVDCVGPAGDHRFSERLTRPAADLRAVLYTSGRTRFERPANLAECLSILSRHPGAKVVCGATDVAVESNLRFKRWPHLISLEGVAALRDFEQTADIVHIGAALPLSEVERLWTSAPDAVRAWSELFSSPPIRNRATLGGNLATASPIGDAAPLLMALDASVSLVSIEGSRMLPLSSFFTGYRKTQLHEDEIIRAVEIPRPYPTFTRFFKASKRRMDDISTVAAGLSIDLDAASRVRRALFAFGGVAASPLRVFAAEEAATGKVWNEQAVDNVTREIERAITPIDDHRGSAEYRKAMAKSLVRRFHHEWQEIVG